MKKKLIFLSIFSFLFLLSSCGISGFEQEYVLAPPLGLKAETISNQIRLSFWAYNSEPYFSGYTIFMAASADTLDQGKGIRIPNDENYSTRATLWKGMQAMSEPTNLIYWVDQDLLKDDKNDTALVSGFNYYFSVRAYSEQYLIYSKDSNITNTVFSNL